MQISDFRVPIVFRKLYPAAAWYAHIANNKLSVGDGQNTDPQSMDYPNGLPNWTTQKWTTAKNNNPNEYYLMFLAASIIKLHQTSAYVHSVQPLATSLNNCA